MNENSQTRPAGWNIPADERETRNAVARDKLRVLDANLVKYEATLRKEER